MSMHIIDDEQRRDRPQDHAAGPSAQFPTGSGGAGASASLPLLDDVHRHRLRRGASHLPPRRSERDPLYFHHGLLGCPGYYTRT